MLETLKRAKRNVCWVLDRVCPVVDYAAPARNFEKRHGVTGLSTPWVMPNHLSYKAMQVRFLADFHYEHDGSASDRASSTLAFAQGRALSPSMMARRDVALRYYDTLAELNPELGKIEFDRNHPFEAFDVVMGAISQFNREDIQYYLRDQRAEYVGDPNESDYAESNRMIIDQMRSNGYPLGWVPDPKTFEVIKAQLGDRMYASRPVGRRRSVASSESMLRR